MPHWRTPQHDDTPLWLCVFLYVTGIAAVCLFATVLFLGAVGAVRGQEHHHRHHPDYQGWINKAGNVPDASTSHACVWHPASKPMLETCQRLLCYQPKPGI